MIPAADAGRAARRSACIEKIRPASCPCGYGAASRCAAEGLVSTPVRGARKSRSRRRRSPARRENVATRQARPAGCERDLAHPRPLRTCVNQRAGKASETPAPTAARQWRSDSRSTMAGSPTLSATTGAMAGQREHAPLPPPIGDEDLRRQGGGQHRAEFAPRAHERARIRNEAERPASTVRMWPSDIGCGENYNSLARKTAAPAILVRFPHSGRAGCVPPRNAAPRDRRVIAALVSVAKKPGAMPLTSTPWGANSIRHGPRQRLRSPPFAAV